MSRMTSLMNMPLEVIASMNNYLDLKSSIQLGAVCKSCVDIVKETLTSKEEHTLNKMLRLVSQQIKNVHAHITDENSKADVLANLLRRLIWTTTTVDEEPPDALAGIQSYCIQEYNNLYLYVNEEMDMSWAMYNTLMENAQFEYRGFHIISLPPQVRTDLDNFKQLVETKYYDNEYKIQVYISLADDIYLEMIFDGIQLSCDVHTRIDERWTFITDMVTDEHSYLEADGGIVFLNVAHEDDAMNELCDLIMTNIRPNVSSNLFKGAESVNLSIWNSVYEENIVFASTIDKWMCKYYTENTIYSHTKIAFQDFNSNR